MVTIWILLWNLNYQCTWVLVTGPFEKNLLSVRWGNGSKHGKKILKIISTGEWFIFIIFFLFYQLDLSCLPSPTSWSFSFFGGCGRWHIWCQAGKKRMKVSEPKGAHSINLFDQYSCDADYFHQSPQRWSGQQKLGGKGKVGRERKDMQHILTEPRGNGSGDWLLPPSCHGTTLNFFKKKRLGNIVVHCQILYSPLSKRKEKNKT